MTLPPRVRASPLVGILVGLLMTILLVVLAGVAFGQSGEVPSERPTYSYDSVSRSAAPAANTRPAAVAIERAGTNTSRLSTSPISFSRAAKGAPLFTQRTASATFRHGPFQGRSIGDIAAGLRSGAIAPSELPVQVIRRNGELLSLNTRSTLALRRGGIDPSDWVLGDVTGNAVWERRLTERLFRNQMGGGSDVIRITGAGPNASWLP